MCEMSLIKNKKSQFGPDVLVGMLLLIVLGLGGVFFLNVFVNGLALNGLLGVLDNEQDNKCFFMLLPLTGDEYIRQGIDEKTIESKILNVNELEASRIETLKNYFGGFGDYENQSLEFKNTLLNMQEGINNHDFTNTPSKIEKVSGYMSTKEESKILMEANPELNDMSRCSLIVYNPFGDVGVANFFVKRGE